MAKNKKKSKHISDILTFVVAAILVAVVVFGIVVMIRQNSPTESEQPKEARNINTASDTLKTEEDLKDEDKVAESSNDSKDRAEAQARNEEEDKKTVAQTESGLKVAKPNINYIAQEGDFIVVGGDVSNINETGGKCTIVFSQGSKAESVTTDTLPNPSYVSCEAGRIEKSKLSAGEWKVKIQYKSNYAEGESEAQNYTIQ
jgi:cytoskeletal protein RodZ